MFLLRLHLRLPRFFRFLLGHGLEDAAYCELLFEYLRLTYPGYCVLIHEGIEALFLALSFFAAVSLNRLLCFDNL